MNTENEPVFRAVQTNPELGARGFIHIYDADISTPGPYVLGIHGGGWSGGDQSSWHDGALRRLVKSLGVSLVLATYRQTPKFRFPCAYDDLVHLLGWLRDNGTAQGLDPSRCLLFGASAGGHLAMLLATRALKEKRPAPGIKGVVNYCGIMDLSAQYDFDTAVRKSPMVENFLGATPQSDPALYRDASPICHIHKHMPPVWMAHGSGDVTVPVAHSRDMARAMTAAGCDTIYLEARGIDHTMLEVGTNGKHIEPYKLLFEDDLRRFMNRSLCGKCD